MSASDGRPLRLGDALARCDRCGRKTYLSELQLEWSGLKVCALTCWDPRPPELDFRVPPDDIAIEGARPDRDPIFIVAVTRATFGQSPTLQDPLTVFDDTDFDPGAFS